MGAFDKHVDLFPDYLELIANKYLDSLLRDRVFERGEFNEYIISFEKEESHNLLK